MVSCFVVRLSRFRPSPRMHLLSASSIRLIGKLEEITEWHVETVNHDISKHFQMLALLSMSVVIEPIAAEVITGKEEQTGLRTWEWRDAGISIRLVQRLPDQTRAFFQGRGFSSATADTIGRACVFQTIFRNDGEQTLTYDLDDWRIAYRGKRLPLQTRERWEDEWLSEDVHQAARIAFRWSLLPTRQSFEPGDYNWGMTSFGLVPGERFDLSLSMRLGDDPISAGITGIICAPDR